MLCWWVSLLDFFGFLPGHSIRFSVALEPAGNSVSDYFLLTSHQHLGPKKTANCNTLLTCVWDPGCFSLWGTSVSLDWLTASVSSFSLSPCWPNPQSAHQSPQFKFIVAPEQQYFKHSQQNVFSLLVYAEDYQRTNTKRVVESHCVHTLFQEFVNQLIIFDPHT